MPLHAANCRRGWRPWLDGCLQYIKQLVYRAMETTNHHISQQQLKAVYRKAAYQVSLAAINSS